MSNTQLFSDHVRRTWLGRLHSLKRQGRLQARLDEYDRQILKYQEDMDRLSEVVQLGYEVLGETTS